MRRVKGNQQEMVKAAPGHAVNFIFEKKKKRGATNSSQKMDYNFFSLKTEGAMYSALEDLQRPCHVLIGSEVCINLCVFALGVWTGDE